MAGLPDYIFVGAGINSLVCAALLGQRDNKVFVLEREDRAGGCIKSGEITLPGYTHDLMAATFVLFVTSPAYRELGASLTRHGLEFAHTSHPTGVVTPDGRSLVMTMDRSANVARFNQLAAGDGDRYRCEVEAVERDAELVFGVLGGAPWSWATVNLLFREMRRRGLRGLAARLGEFLRPGRGWLETQFQSDLLRDMLAPWVLHVGLGPESALSGEMARVIAFALESAGAPIAKGGAARAVKAFEGLIGEQAGEVRTGADVTEVLVDHGRAVGVKLASGETIEAKRGVVCSVTPTQLYNRLLPDTAVDPAVLVHAANYRYGRGDMQMHFALKSPPKWKSAGLEEVALIHLTPGLDGVSKAVNECERGLLPEVPTICVGQPHALDPSRCPPGAGIIWVQLPEAPRHIKGDAAGKIQVPADGTWHEAVREAFADRVEAILNNHIDGLEGNVLARKSYSPADLEAININLVGGDPYGGSCAIDQFFILRPFPNSVNYQTSINGLYLIGASTHPGPGLGGGSGFALAERLS